MASYSIITAITCTVSALSKKQKLVIFGYLPLDCFSVLLCVGLVKTCEAVTTVRPFIDQNRLATTKLIRKRLKRCFLTPFLSICCEALWGKF